MSELQEPLRKENLILLLITHQKMQNFTMKSVLVN